MNRYLNEQTVFDGGPLWRRQRRRTPLEFPFERRQMLQKPRRWEHPKGSLENLPIPPGAFSDPWEHLNSQCGLPEPLEEPTAEVLAELEREVERQIRLQQLTGKSETITGNKLSTQEKGPPAAVDSGEKTISDIQNSTPSDSSAPSSWPQRGPMVLPPPCQHTEDPPDDEGAQAQAEAARASQNKRVDPLRVFMGVPSGRGRGFRLPAATNGSGGDAEGSVTLSLDEESIREKLSAERKAPVEGLTLSAKVQEQTAAAEPSGAVD